MLSFVLSTMHNLESKFTSVKLASSKFEKKKIVSSNCPPPPPVTSNAVLSALKDGTIS